MPWIIGGAVVAVVAAGALALAWFLTPRATAEDQALTYLRALADGDITAVEATGVDVPATAAAAFGAASDHLSDGVVESSTEDERAAVVMVSYELAGERHDSTLTLSLRDGRWVPDAATALGSVQLSVPASIHDTALPADGAVLLPALYDVSAAPVEFLDGTATVDVPLGSLQEVGLDAILRPEATDTAQAQLDEYLAACTKTAAEAPPSCGIVIPWAADFSAVNEIRYRIEQAPSLALTPTSFHADGGVLVATVTGAAPDGSEKSLTYRTPNWSLRGDVEFTADDIVLSVW